MLTRRMALGLVGGGALFGATRHARADAGGVSDWSKTDHARIRLIDAGLLAAPEAPASQRLAGLEVDLDPGFLTYWRFPGEAGVPPVASFDGSANLASATLLFPAPGRFDEGGAEAFGYHESVVFPLAVTPADPVAPVRLALSLAFAVCSTLCLPVRGATALDLGGSGAGVEAGLVRDALARVPVVRGLGAPGHLSILSVTAGPAPGTATVVARAKGETLPALFVEAPDEWYFQSDTGLRTSADTITYSVKILSSPSQLRAQGVPLRLTLAGDAGAIEVDATLDGATSKT